MSDQVLKILEQYGEKDRSNVWAIQGNTIVKHAALERVAAKAGIKFLPPSILRAEQEEAVILVTGQLGERTEWSIGEALVNVNYRVSGKQAAYVYAMAEKRAKDRVILKLVGLHGLAYSEDEADDFKASAPAVEPPKQAKAAVPATPLPTGMEPTAERPEVAEYLQKVAMLLDVCDTNEEIDEVLKAGASQRKSIGLVEGSPSWNAFKSIVELGRKAVMEAA